MVARYLASSRTGSPALLAPIGVPVTVLAQRTDHQAVSLMQQHE
jgi:hypothetical protein